MLTDAGFAVEWIRPRTVLAEQTVVRALRVDRARMSSLVDTELRLSRSRQGESLVVAPELRKRGRHSYPSRYSGAVPWTEPGISTEALERPLCVASEKCHITPRVPRDGKIWIESNGLFSHRRRSVKLTGEVREHVS